MDDRTVDDDEPPLKGRGVMSIDEFSRETGLDRPTVDALVTDRKVEGLRHLDGRVFGIFDDVLPTKEELRSWGWFASETTTTLNVTVPTSAPMTIRIPSVARKG